MNLVCASVVLHGEYFSIVDKFEWKLSLVMVPDPLFVCTSSVHSDGVAKHGGSRGHR